MVTCIELTITFLLSDYGVKQTVLEGPLSGILNPPTTSIEKSPLQTFIPPSTLFDSLVSLTLCSE